MKWNILIIKEDEEININLTKEEAKELYDNDLIAFRKSAMKRTLNPIDFCINFNLLIKMAELLGYSESNMRYSLKE